MKVRVKFSKHGPIRFIGHLDVMRYFQKTIRRAGIDVAYTGGFSPHQIMSFAAPLGVGLESDGEYMDIEVNSMVSCEDLKDRLNNASIPGIRILSVKVLPEKAPNAMASVAAAKYSVSFREGRTPELFAGKSVDQMKEIIKDYLNRDEILLTKVGKAGPRQVDIKPGIYELVWEENGFKMLVDASSAGNIKPIQILETMLAEYGQTLAENALFITREETYTNGAMEGELIPLDQVGTETL